MNTGKKLFGLQKNIFFAGLVSFFMDVSSEMVYPLVPLFLSNALGVNKLLIGLIEGIAESTASILNVFSGWWSDRIGRRKGLLIAGYATSTLSRPIMAAAHSWPQVLISRFADRVGKGIRTAPRDAIIAESSEPEYLSRSFSFHRSMDTMGAVIGPLLALLLLQLFASSYRTVFWLSMVPGMIAVFIIIAFITESGSSTRIKRKSSFSLNLKAIDGKARFFILIATVFALGNSSDMFLILKAQHAGIPASVIPGVYLLFNLIYSISALPAGIVADRFGKKRVILTGFVLFAALYYGFAVATTTTAIWFLFGFYGLFMGLTEGIQKAFFATIIPPQLKATAFGVYSTAVGISKLPASLIAGLLWDKGSPAMTFYFGATTSVISAMLFIMLIIISRNSNGTVRNQV
jgi:MFS family permease